MPLESITDSFLPSRKSEGALSLKKLCCSSSKTMQQCVKQDERSDTGIGYACLVTEGLSF